MHDMACWGGVRSVWGVDGIQRGDVVDRVKGMKGGAGRDGLDLGGGTRQQQPKFKSGFISKGQDVYQIRGVGHRTQF